MDDIQKTENTALIKQLKKYRSDINVQREVIIKNLAAEMYLDAAVQNIENAIDVIEKQIKS